MGIECSSHVHRETAWVVSGLADVEGCINSEKMGNKELRDGCFSFNDGIKLCKCPTTEVARVVFLLYHMNNIPKTIKHTPISMSNAIINLGDKENG